VKNRREERPWRTAVGTPVENRRGNVREEPPWERPWRTVVGTSAKNRREEPS
jgi:hypothetical protein